MISTFIYFALAMLFIAGVVWYLWKTDSSFRKKALSLNDEDDNYLSEPATLHPRINSSLCNGCGICAEACPEKIIEMKDGKALLNPKSHCLGHGSCFQTCPADAITLNMGSDRRGESLPHLYQNFETSTPGIFIAGELGGMGLITCAAEQAKQAVRYITNALLKGHGADYDLVIVGAGTAGLTAALTAKKNDLRFIVLEQDTMERSFSNYPRTKVKGKAVLDLPLAGKVVLKNTTKKQLTGIWHDIILKYRIPVQENCKVESVLRFDRHFNVASSDYQNFSAAFVLFTIGRRGTPEKLNVPGEHMEKVAYRLPDPDNCFGKKIIVAGGENAAVEAALLLSERNNVTLICRNDVLGRLTPLNRKSIEKAVGKGRITIFFKTRIKSIEEKFVVISSENGTIKIQNDLVFVLEGGESTAEFLERAGVNAAGIPASELMYLE